MKTLSQLSAERSWQQRDQFEKQLEALLGNRTPEGDVALAYLLRVYLGEHPAEEMVCEAINRGPRMAPLVRAFRDCARSTEMAPLPRGIVLGDPALNEEVLQKIAQGETCAYED